MNNDQNLLYLPLYFFPGKKDNCIQSDVKSVLFMNYTGYLIYKLSEVVQFCWCRNYLRVWKYIPFNSKLQRFSFSEHSRFISASLTLLLLIRKYLSVLSYFSMPFQDGASANYSTYLANWYQYVWQNSKFSYRECALFFQHHLRAQWILKRWKW